jgi:hypothetical protein
MHRPLVREIFVLHHLPDVIGDVRAEIASSQSQFANCHLGVTNVEKHHCLDIVDVVNPEPFQLPASPPPGIDGECARRKK